MKDQLQIEFLTPPSARRRRESSAPSLPLTLAVFPWPSRFLPAAAGYLGALLVSLTILTLVLQLWHADLRVPFCYTGDALAMQMLTKSVMDHGSYLHNEFIGAPFGSDLHDYPRADSLHFLFVKLISFFTSDYGVVYNLYYLLTFPLTTVICLYVLRHFNLSYAVSLLIAILYTFLPYHFSKFQLGHYLECCYYLVPLMAMVILWTYLDMSPFFAHDRENGRVRFRLVGGRAIAALLICLLCGCAGVYYAFFGCFLLLVSGVAASIYRKAFYPFLGSAILVATVTLAILGNLAPTFWYVHKHGANSQAVQRHPGESELYGLKIVQLLLPVDGHRVRILANLKNLYNRTAPIINENNCASLGILGGLGFLASLGHLFCRRIPEGRFQLYDALGSLNIFAVLLATAGGFGVLLCYFTSPWLPPLGWIRGYNRMSVYVAFFSLFTLGLILEALYRFCMNKRKGSLFFYASIGVLLLLGILDQTTKGFKPDYNSLTALYDNDRDFVGRLEACLPKNAMVFVLPAVPFPEHAPVQQLQDYELFRGYLHSRTLRWSYGNLKGREGDLWHSAAAAKPIDQLVPFLSRAGFSGIYVDRKGFADHGTELESKLRGILNITPLADARQSVAFFDMTNYNRRLREYDSP